MQSSLLITGATGNVGSALVRELLRKDTNLKLYAAVRKGDDSFAASNGISPLSFDFEDLQSVKAALGKTDILFLLRPPQISDTENVFAPLISIAKEEGVKHIIFLSVQGAESNSIIPHHKIENLIKESGISYTFLRPAYFMQNFTGTFLKDIKEKQEIFIPAGRAKFTIVDVDDIAKFTAEILDELSVHRNKAYELTNNELLSFQEMSDQLTEVLGKTICYKSPNLISFFIRKKREGVPSMLILVMIMLHYFPRFKSTPNRSEWIKNLTQQEPKIFKRFLEENKDTFLAG